MSSEAMNENVPQDVESDIEDGSAEMSAEDFNIVEETERNDGSDDIDESSQDSVIGKLKAALVESEKRALIAVADLENYRKRAGKNAQEQIKYASLPLMNDILEIVDNLNRAVESASPVGNDSGLLEGVKMVSDQLLNVLQTNHCKAIEAVGKPFDPNLHQAVQMQPSTEFPENMVMMEMRPGYILHERVIRPSQVFVSTGSPEQGQDTE